MAVRLFIYLSFLSVMSSSWYLLSQVVLIIRTMFVFMDTIFDFRFVPSPRKSWFQKSEVWDDYWPRLATHKQKRKLISKIAASNKNGLELSNNMDFTKFLSKSSLLWYYIWTPRSFSLRKIAFYSRNIKGFQIKRAMYRDW